MRFSFLLPGLFFLTSCSSAPKTNSLSTPRTPLIVKIRSVDISEDVREALARKQPLPVRESATVRVVSIAVSSDEEGKNFVRNRRDFLERLYEQSIEPYWGKPKLDPTCLKENRLGTLEESAAAIYAKSRLTAETGYEFGLCHEPAEPLRLLHYIGYCLGSHLSVELQIFTSRDNSLDWPDVQVFCGTNSGV